MSKKDAKKRALIPKSLSKLMDSKDIHEYYHSIISTMPNNVYWLDKNSVFQGCNENVAKMLGLKSTADIIGLTHEQTAKLANWTEGQAASFKHDDQEVIASGVPKINVEEPPITDVQGKKIYFLTTRVPLKNREGKIIGVVGISIDITERKKMEENLRKTKEEAEAANKLKSEFIHNMEHDIRTPFSGVWGLTKLMLDEETDPEKKMLLGDIEKCAKELLDYCNNILDFAKTESGVIPILEKKFDLKALIERIIIMELPESRRKKIALLSDIADDLPTVVIGDQHRIERVLLNLVGNAFKFTQQGHVKIIAKVAKKIKNEKIIIQLKVEDTGIGIPKDKQDLIYEKFTRGTPSNKGLYKGTGLGLHVVKQLIKDIKGEIDVVSEEGKGTTFICTIPFKVPLVDQVLNSE